MHQTGTWPTNIDYKPTEITNFYRNNEYSASSKSIKHFDNHQTVSIFPEQDRNFYIPFSTDWNMHFKSRYTLKITDVSTLCPDTEPNKKVYQNKSLLEYLEPKYKMSCKHRSCLLLL